MTGVVVCLATGHNLMFALLFGLALFFGFGMKRGYSLKTLWRMSWNKGKRALIVVPVFLLIGTITGLWRSSGTISYFLYYGIRHVTPSLFILTAFVLSATLSFLLGTCYGVTGTAGVVFITLARSGNVSLAVTGGAILSGAYFGDRCSPMSSCAALVAATTDSTLYHNVLEMLKTAALPTGLTLLFYGCLSGQYPIQTVDEAILNALTNRFSLHWVVLVPAVLMLILPLCRVPVKIAMVASSGVALVLSVTLQKFSIFESLKIALLGFHPQDPALQWILSGGGLVSMLTASGIVFVTSLYSGILEGMNLLNEVRSNVDRLVKKIGKFPATVLISTLTIMVFCNQSVMTILDDQLLRDAYRQRGGSPTEFAMDIANSGVTIAGLVPWSIAVTVPLSMIDVGLEAIPYAALLYLIPICYGMTRKWFVLAQNRYDAKEDLIL